MQDSAPSHAAKLTRAMLRHWGIEVLTWPPFSPDLNPIETLWNILKDYLQARMDAAENWTQEQLRGHLMDCWDQIQDEVLDELIESMKARCEAVIATEGGYTRF